MGFTGRPSTGCASCKRKKKKCDLTKPHCRRCTSSGKECPGVPEEVDLVFRNTFITNTKRSLHSSRKGNTTGVQQSYNQEQAEADREQNQLVLAIPPTVPVDWIDAARTYYFKSHCRRDLPTRRLNPWLQLESQFYVATGHGTGLKHAVNALATVTMAADLQLPELAHIANNEYGKALRSINTALASPSEFHKNEVAVSIFALISFELKEQTQVKLHRHQTHVDGLKELLIMRGRRQFTALESLKVFRALRVPIVYNYMLRGVELIGDNDEWLWTDANPYNATPVDELIAVAARIPGLRARMKQIRSSKSAIQPRALLTDAYKVDVLMAGWLSKWQDHLGYDVIITSNVREGPGPWKNRYHSFTDLPLAVLMNHYYFFRLQVLDALLYATKALDDVTEDSRVIVRQMQDLVDDLCFSVPFMTAEVREKCQNLANGQNRRWIYPSHAEATWILLPIIVTARHDFVGAIQKEWLFDQLRSLNADFGLVDASSMPRGSKEDLRVVPGS